MTNGHAPVDLQDFETGSVETLIIGGGSSGATLAGLECAKTDGPVLLIEAGPDYGHLAEGRWPRELLDAAQLPQTHDWGYSASATEPDRISSFDRARVIGGCSSHNGCQAIIGHRADYNAWLAAGNHGWGASDLVPAFKRALARMRVRQPGLDDLTPFHAATFAAIVATGIPPSSDLNDLDEISGVGPNPANEVEGLRWNASFAYLDPIRSRPNMVIVSETFADRLLIRGDRVVGAVLVRRGRTVSVSAHRVILAAGAYGSPAILLRSGVGDPKELKRLGIEQRHKLPGVGLNLQDHAAIAMRFAGTPELRRRSRHFAKSRLHPEEQLVAKVVTSRAAGIFDVHIYTQGGPRRGDASNFIWELMAAILKPNSRGRVSLQSADPQANPLIDHAFLSDPDDEDLRVLKEGFQALRAIAKRSELATLIGAETAPGAEYASDVAIGAALRHFVTTAYHPVGTCKMGPEDDKHAVVDSNLKVHGLEGIYVVDASVMPTIPRANTNLPTIAIAEHFATSIDRFSLSVGASNH